MVIEGKNITGNLFLEADVCIIGSGAGGAVAAKELAEAGKSVIVLEEGGYYTTEFFKKTPLERMNTMYRDKAMTATIGEPAVALPLGRCIGGTTTVNSGTCFRTPEKVLKEWQNNYGLIELNEENLYPIFEKVEKIISVQPVSYDIMGKNNLIIKKGADILGYSGGPLKRNQKDCVGGGFCAFGCVHGAKQSMLVSYLPLAQKYGAQIYSDCLVTEILMENKTATGVKAIFLNKNIKYRKPQLTVKSKIVLVAGGTICTPSLLQKTKLPGKYKLLGRNLHIHPACRLVALFEEKIQGWKGVPQSYFVDELFDSDNLMLEGAFIPPEYLAAGLPFFGVEHKELMSRYENISSFGVMVSDHLSEGKVINGFFKPLMFYNFHQEEAEKLLKGLVLGAEIYFAAGAKEVYTGLHNLTVLKSRDEIKKLKEIKVKPNDMELVAFHPMGTARMGTDIKNSVVNVFGLVHNTKNLFVCDGSVLPSSLGVNPQLTIMCLSNWIVNHILENENKYF